jgi:hypothetical protein
MSYTYKCVPIFPSTRSQLSTYNRPIDAYNWPFSATFVAPLGFEAMVSRTPDLITMDGQKRCWELTPQSERGSKNYTPLLTLQFTSRNHGAKQYTFSAVLRKLLIICISRNLLMDLVLVFFYCWLFFSRVNCRVYCVYVSFRRAFLLKGNCGCATTVCHSTPFLF